MKKIFFSLLLCGVSAIVFAGTGTNRLSEGVVVQANGNDIGEFKRALVLASNMREVLTKAKFEIVVYGPSVQFLTAFSDALPLIQKVQSEGIKVIACGRSLETEKVALSDLAPEIKVVQFGAVHIVNREKQGWQYIKP